MAPMCLCFSKASCTIRKTHWIFSRPSNERKYPITRISSGIYWRARFKTPGYRLSVHDTFRFRGVQTHNHKIGVANGDALVAAAVSVCNLLTHTAAISKLGSKTSARLWYGINGIRTAPTVTKWDLSKLQNAVCRRDEIRRIKLRL